MPELGETDGLGPGPGAAEAARTAAERLVREAERAARAAAREVPERGWATPEEPETAPALSPELVQAASALLELARGSSTPELSRQLTDALRELGLAVRAIIDHNLERLERPEPPRTEDG